MVEPLESVTMTVKLKVPALVGVPEIMQLPRISPGGRAPATILHVYVPQLGVIEWTYGSHTTPFGGIGGSCEFTTIV